MVDFELNQDFSVQMAQLEITDPVHADTFNTLYKQLINNDDKLNQNKIETSEKGSFNGIATLDPTGNVPLTQLGNVHDKYTDSEAVAAINSDSNHGSTAQHDYFSGVHGDLSGIGSDDHHIRYADSEAIAAINSDSNHGSTAQHDYFSGDYLDLANKPSIAYSSAIPADAFTSGEVSNLQSNGLADGSQPWQTPLIQTTVSYTLQSTDYTVTCDTSSGDITITLPDASTVPDKIYNVKKVDESANSIIIDGDGTQTIDGETTREINVQYESITVQSTGNEWVII